MADFSAHGSRPFLRYAKDSTDILTARAEYAYNGRMRKINNVSIMNELSMVYSIQFFSSIVGYWLDSDKAINPQPIYNKRGDTPLDFRYEGSESAKILWPDPFNGEEVVVSGGLFNKTDIDR